MQRVFMTMNVKPGGEKEYIRRHDLLMHHDRVPDETVTQEELDLCRETWKVHKDAGIRNYSIFMAGTKLYAYFEAEDYQKALEIVTKSEAGQRWQQYMDGFLVQENGVPVMEVIDQPIFSME